MMFLPIALVLSRLEPVDLGATWIGKPAKSAVVKDENGVDVDLGKVIGKRPVVLVFYRGVW